MSKIKVSGGQLAAGKPVESELRMRVVRADGRIEELGVVSYWSSNPLKRWWFAIKRSIGKVR